MPAKQAHTKRTPGPVHFLLDHVPRAHEAKPVTTLNSASNQVPLVHKDNLPYGDVVVVVEVVSRDAHDNPVLAQVNMVFGRKLLSEIINLRIKPKQKESLTA